MNDGKCGICGDAFNEDPRPHEAPGGTWGNTGILVGEYQPGEWIDVTIEVRFYLALLLSTAQLSVVILHITFVVVLRHVEN